MCVLFCFPFNWKCFSAFVSGVLGLRKLKQPRLKLQLMRAAEMCSFQKGMNPDSCLLRQDFSSVTLKVQAMEGEVLLKGLSN